jgi:hypothetical protein
MQATFGQGLVSDPLDKLASFLIVYLIVLALPLRLKARFPMLNCCRSKRLLPRGHRGLGVN